MRRSKDVVLSDGSTFTVQELTTKELLTIKKRGEASGTDLLSGLVLGELEAFLEILAIQEGLTVDELADLLTTAGDLMLVEEAWREVNEVFFKTYPQRFQNLLGMSETLAPLLKLSQDGENLSPE